jgi:hypothetical protein
LIRIDIKRSGTHIEEVMVTGHGGGREGSDIVCAAVSAVTQTALAGLLYHLEGNVLHKMSKGQIFISIPPQVSGFKLEVSQIILSTMLLGLEQVAGQYPEKIRIYSDGKRIKPGTSE